MHSRALVGTVGSNSVLLKHLRVQVACVVYLNEGLHTNFVLPAPFWGLKFGKCGKFARNAVAVASSGHVCVVF